MLQRDLDVMMILSSGNNLVGIFWSEPYTKLKDTEGVPVKKINVNLWWRESHETEQPHNN